MKITAQAKLTKNCFKGFSYRDPDIDTWLPKKQPALSGTITVIQLKKEMTFLEMAKEYFGTTDVEEIKKHTLTLPMVEELIKNHESELKTDGWGNFFLVESNDGVSVAYVIRVDSRWNANVRRLDGDNRWDAGFRLLVRGLEPTDTLSLDHALEIVKEAGYEVKPLTLAMKFRAFKEKRGNGSGEDYWQGLEKIAEEHYKQI
ncbi:MAG: hypothetical protein ACYDAK_13295 [Candidatus Limnocylindrales bacterium]